MTLYVAYLAFTKPKQLVRKCDAERRVLDAEFSDDFIHDHFVEHIGDNDGDFDSTMDAEQQNIRGQSDALRAICKMMRKFDARIIFLMTSQVTCLQSCSLTYSHLEGAPGEPRRVAVSVKECVKYYIALSGRQFAEDELFTLVAFDRISLQNVFIHNSVRCKRFPRIYEGYETIGSEQLGNALLTNERRRQGCLPRTRSTDRTTKGICIPDTIRSTGTIRNADANTDNSLVLVQYAGVSSVETLFDVLDARMPIKAELREANLGNDCASALLFMRQVDVFIKYVLGVDPATKKPTPHRGLFGTVQTYNLAWLKRKAEERFTSIF
ncbi:hypothetical protein GQ600_7801 [Phytophthora cactorum]|nr:hypothetical protein GQ600_7801 [Phytophthora cactorum]